MKPLMCPEHNVPLVRKRIEYGLIPPEEMDGTFISGGCCLSEHARRVGYECPVDQMVFYRDKSGKAFSAREEEE